MGNGLPLAEVAFNLRYSSRCRLLAHRKENLCTEEVIYKWPFKSSQNQDSIIAASLEMVRFYVYFGEWDVGFSLTSLRGVCLCRVMKLKWRKRDDAWSPRHQGITPWWVNTQCQRRGHEETPWLWTKDSPVPYKSCSQGDMLCTPGCGLQCRHYHGNKAILCT